jgi:hypothetical protein
VQSIATGVPVEALVDYLHLWVAVDRFSSVISLTKDFNFVIAKISVTTELTEFREIRPKFRRYVCID